jgi:transcriptional regulator with XRE-family HTH domain
LAFAVGTDQAHISRIEGNQIRPQFQTLDAICEALNLSSAERDEILSLAGFRIALPLPDKDAVGLVLQKLGPVLDSLPYPAMLLDEGERIWHWNAFCFYPWGQSYGASNQHEFLSRVRGKRHLEVIFDPQAYPASYFKWAARWENIDHIIRRNIALLWRAFRVRQQDQEMNQALNRLKANPDFLKIWRQILRGPEEILIVEHDTQAVWTELGRLEFHVWRTHAAADTRFVVVHFTPSDVPTIDALMSLAKAAACRSVK